MKSLGKIIILFIGLSFAQVGFSQVKIAHINSAELMQMLPEVDTIELRLTNLRKQYENSLKGIENELKVNMEYWESDPTTDPVVLEMRQVEYQELTERYSAKQQEANVKLQQKQQEWLNPVVEKLKAQIIEVAKSKGYTYVMDSSEGGSIIYGDPAHDLMSAMKAKLNLP
jgi:outer membrane protein